MYLILVHTNEGKIETYIYNSFIAVYEAKNKWEDMGYYVEFYVRTELRF